MPTNQSEKTVVEKESRKAHKQSKQEKEKKPAEKAQSASEKQTRKQQKKKQKEEIRKDKKPRRRIFPIWLRIIIVLLLCASALVVGLMIGYGVIGDGTPSDALKKETWQHIIDIVTKAE